MLSVDLPVSEDKFSAEEERDREKTGFGGAVVGDASIEEQHQP